MQLQSILSLLLLTSAFSLHSMEISDNNNPKAPEPFKHYPRESYPDGMGFMAVENVLKELPPIPQTVKDEVDEFFEKKPKLYTFIQMPTDVATFHTINKQRSVILGNKSAHNIVLFTLSKKLVVKIASLASRIKNIRASQNYDPYNPAQLNDTQLAQALAFNGPTMQHITYAIGQHLLEQSQSTAIEVVPTYLYHLEGRPDALDDNNYIAVQEALGEQVVQFKDLDLETKKEALNNLDLGEFYKALKYAHYAFPSEDNLWVDMDSYKIMLPDSESPNNEGLGTKIEKPNFRKAVFGQSVFKARWNIRNEYDGGHRIFENILQKYAPQLIATWKNLYTTDSSQ